MNCRSVSLHATTPRSRLKDCRDLGRAYEFGGRFLDYAFRQDPRSISYLAPIVRAAALETVAPNGFAIDHGLLDPSTQVYVGGSLDLAHQGRSGNREEGPEDECCACWLGSHDCSLPESR